MPLVRVNLVCLCLLLAGVVSRGSARAASGASPGIVRGTTPARLRIAFVIGDSSASAPALAGVQFGVEEAVRTASLVNAAMPVLTIVETGRKVAAADVIIAGDSLGCDQVARSASDRSRLVMLAGCSGAATLAKCGSLVFGVGTLEPGAVLWLPSLEAFGAAQLNERYMRRTQQPMNSGAWAGWMSVRLVTEPLLRGVPPAAAALAHYLLKSDARFDGHKGVALSFASSHLLSGPVYDPVSARAIAATRTAPTCD